MRDLEPGLKMAGIKENKMPFCSFKKDDKGGTMSEKVFLVSVPAERCSAVNVTQVLANRFDQGSANATFGWHAFRASLSYTFITPHHQNI
jgi:hypothetical protein